MTVTRAFPPARDAPPMPDLRHAACYDNPAAFDLDMLEHSQTAADAAARRCSQECPVFTACAAWTDQLAASAVTRPSGVVQAGRIFGLHASRARPDAAEMRTLADLPPDVRAAHARYVKLRQAGVRTEHMDSTLIEGERIYQSVAARAKRARAKVLAEREGI